jgi:hypothetical protein
MFKIDCMQLVGLDDKEGLVLSWKPDGFLIEMSTHKVLTTKPDGFLIEMSTHKVLTTKPDGFLI